MIRSLETFAPRLEALGPAQRHLWSRLASTPPSFVLYGGTALALRLGHRASVDFDFFSSSSFQPDALERQVDYLGAAERLQSQRDTLVALVASPHGPVKVAYFGGLPLARVSPPDLAQPGGIRVASLLDLAATKFKVVQDRAELKDYQDLAAVLRAGLALDTVARAALAVYRGALNPLISLKALSYFDEGDVRTLSGTDRRLLADAVRALDPGALCPLETDDRELSA
jgi:hypothetical protein